MRLLLLTALGVLLWGCANNDAAGVRGCTLASGDRACLVEGGQPKKGESQREFKEATTGRAVKGNVDAAAGSPPDELIPRGSLEEFKFCTTVFQTPFDQFTCLKDLQNR